jgi:CheY-like chemotaxis protein
MSAGSKHAGRKSSSRVLVADDDRTMARGLQLVLTLWGLDVTVVHDGAAALAAVRAFNPEVVLLDLGLPKIDGLEVARTLRREQRPIQLVALTGYGDERHRRLSRDAGFNEHLVKPVDPLLLRGLLTGTRDD